MLGLPTNGAPIGGSLGRAGRLLSQIGGVMMPIARKGRGDGEDSLRVEEKGNMPLPHWGLRFVKHLLIGPAVRRADEGEGLNLVQLTVKEP